jgi:hypothetical protein
VYIRMSTAPTAREICLVLILLTTLLAISKTNHDFSLRKTPRPVLSGLDGNPLAIVDSPVLADHHHAAQNWRTRLSWGSEPVPETKVVAHVPGAFFSL